MWVSETSAAHPSTKESFTDPFERNLTYNVDEGTSKEIHSEQGVSFTVVQ
jgi:hypothetical protein